VKSSFSSWKGWLPMADSVWSAKQIRIEEQHTICALPADEGSKHIIIILGSSGKFYKYSYTNTSDECQKITEGNYFSGSIQ